MFSPFPSHLLSLPPLPSSFLPLQDKPFNFEEVPALQDSLKKFHFLDSDVLYDVSSTREQK